MKHSLKVTAILISMFLIAQLIGIYVAHIYSPVSYQVLNETTGDYDVIEDYNLPYGFNPPTGVSPTSAATSIIIALIIAVLLMLMLMKMKAEVFLRIWFLIVIVIGLAIAINAFFIEYNNSYLIALVLAIPLGMIKVFRRSIIVHNLTELLIYPGIAVIFISLLNVWSTVILLVIVSIYDIYAVWHAGFMQKMAKYQMENVKVFSGFFVPYIRKKDREMIRKFKESGAKKMKKRIKIESAILGGGDVVFPIILAGVVLHSIGLIPALMIAIGATISLAILFYKSKKGEFYPAMPFISAGCLIALAIAYMI